MIFLNNFSLHYSKNAYNQRGVNNVTHRTARLLRHTLTTKLLTINALRNEQQLA